MSECPSRWGLMHVNAPFLQALTSEFGGTWQHGVPTCLNATSSILHWWPSTSAWAPSGNTALNMGLHWKIMTWFLTGTTPSYSGKARLYWEGVCITGF